MPSACGRRCSSAAPRRGVALVSDAGTPLVSDPGFKLVRDALAEGLPVTTLPGASAPLAALVLVGPADRPLPLRRLPAGEGRRRGARELPRSRGVPATLVFFEWPRRLAETLADMAAALGDRPAAVARELTKLFEEVRRGRLAELAAHYAAAGRRRARSSSSSAPPHGAADAGADAGSSTRCSAPRSPAHEPARCRRRASPPPPGCQRRDVYARALALAAEPGQGMTGTRRAAAPPRWRVRRGHRAETLCLWHLRLRGYRILARGYRVAGGRDRHHRAARRASSP